MPGQPAGAFSWDSAFPVGTTETSFEGTGDKSDGGGSFTVTNCVSYDFRMRTAPQKAGSNRVILDTGCGHAACADLNAAKNIRDGASWRIVPVNETSGTGVSARRAAFALATSDP